MDNKTFAKLVGDLREDKKLFHAFIFEPDTALKKLTYLDDSTKRILKAIDPRSFIADAAGLLEKEKLLACGSTCHFAFSCIITCSFGTTCSDTNGAGFQG